MRRLQETVRSWWPRIRIRDLSLTCGDLVALQWPFLQLECAWLSKTPEVGVVSRKTTGRAGPEMMLGAWG